MKFTFAEITFVKNAVMGANIKVEHAKFASGALDKIQKEHERLAKLELQKRNNPAPKAPAATKSK